MKVGSKGWLDALLERSYVFVSKVSFPRKPCTPHELGLLFLGTRAQCGPDPTVS